MRTVLFTVLLAGCSGSYPRLPAPIEVAPQSAAPTVRATDLLRLRDATGSATSAKGVWDPEVSMSRRTRVAASSHTAGVLGYRLVQVSPTTLSFDGRPLLPLNDGAVPEVARRGNLISTLEDELRRWRLAAEEGDDQEQMQASVEELGLVGIYIDEEPRRFYSSGDYFARGTIGLAGVDNQGVSGLELQYDEYLTGESGLEVGERNLYGGRIPNGRIQIEEPVEYNNFLLVI